MKQLYILLAIALTVVTSCEKEITFNGKITEPLVVVNSFLMPDTLVKVEVSKSKFFLDSKYSFDRVDNATVSIVVNGSTSEVLSSVGNGIYTGTYTPQPGDSVAVLVKVPGEEDIRSSTVVQQPSTILSIDTLGRKEMDRYGSYVYNDTIIMWNIPTEYEIGIRIKDPAGEKNFYRLSILMEQELQHSPGVFNGYYIYFNIQGVSNEASSGSILDLIGGSADDEFHVFTDDLFDGKEAVIRFKHYESIWEVRPGYEHMIQAPDTYNKRYHINLQTLPQETYLFLKSKTASEQVVDALFTEPVQIYSNIQHGIGIFGALTNNIKIVKSAQQANK